MTARVVAGDCLAAMRKMADRGEVVQSIVTDPPYGLEFMGVAWDSFADRPKGKARTRNEWGDFGSREHARHPSEHAGIQRRKNLAFADFSAAWAEAAFAILPPGGHLIAFGGTRTYHRLACAIEDAGFEIRDQLAWVFGQGFPKSRDVSKAIDAEAGAVRKVVGSKGGRYATPMHDFRGGALHHGADTGRTAMLDQITAPATPEAAAWAGWGTALKPSWEPIVLARKPLAGTVASNVLRFGTGGLNIDGCRVATSEDLNGGRYSDGKDETDGPTYGAGMNRRSAASYAQPTGRWPASLLHDGSPEVEAAFASFGNKGAAAPVRGTETSPASRGRVTGPRARVPGAFHGDTGSPSRFFYCAKATATDRAGSKHPTVKPIALMRWLCRLITPPGGTVLDPFAGSGTTLAAARAEGFHAIGIEREAEYVRDIKRRLAA